MNINIRGKLFDLSKPKVMGILNLTPNSFYDGGVHNEINNIENHVNMMVEDGMDILDIGGYSSKPGAKNISVDEEMTRVIPVLKNIRKIFPDLVISIDTFRSKIASMSLDEGADMINDISGGTLDKNMMSVVAKNNCPYILMHMQGNPQTMQINPKYHHVLIDIYDFFENEIKKFKKHKYHKKLILDPGIGFGKNLKHNLMILKKISLFHSLGFPILIGTSRKRFISQISGKYDSKERIGGTLSSIIFSFSQGIKMFRVHNVEEVKQGLLVFETLLKK